MKYNEEAKLRIQAVKVTEKRLEYSIWCFFGGGVAGMSGSIGIYAMQSPTNKKKTTSPPEDDLVEVLD